MDAGHEATDLTLRSVSGPAMGPVVLDPSEEAVLGRSEECSISLADPSVSRRHAVLALRDGMWTLSDLGSRHGTYLNGERISDRRAVIVAEGDLLRIGPYSMRFASPHQHAEPMTIMDPVLDAGSHIEQVSDREMNALARFRLDLMLDGATAIHRATSEQDLAEAVVDLLVAGTGFPRAAVLRFTGSAEQVEIVSSRDDTRADTGDLVFSRSLLEAAASGQVVRLSAPGKVDLGQSIEQLGITRALCAPLMIDETVAGALYLDARDGEAGAQPEAAGYCRAVSRLASLALSSLKRAELEERQRSLENELRLAQEAQSFLLPQPGGRVGSLHYAMRSVPGAVVGGDLFDIFPIDDSRVGICFGDVTGHGIGAAIVMTAALSHLRAAMSRAADPVAAVAEVNRYLTEHSSARMFASLWVGLFDAREQAIEFVDAGHGHWLIAGPDLEPHRPEAPGSTVVGIQDDVEHAAQRVAFTSGTRLLLYSDGITEQRDPGGEEFGGERLNRMIASSSSIDSDIENTFDALSRFSGGRAFNDDTTLASVEFRG